MNNMYSLLKEYRTQQDEKEKKLFLMALDHSTRTSLKSLIVLQDDNNRFENMYDGWISTVKEEMILLEVYSFTIETVDYLNQYCVSAKVKKEFDMQQSSMIKLLMKNRQFHTVSQLLNIRMEDESFKEKKILELKDFIKNYLKKRGLNVPNKLSEQLLIWVDARRFPPYMLGGFNEQLQFKLYGDPVDTNTLAVKIAKAYQRTPRDINKIIDELLEYRDLKS